MKERMTRSYRLTKELSQLQGTCEDRIYCAAFYDCGSLNMKTCKQIICDYMERDMNIGTLPAGDPQLADKLVGFDASTGAYGGYIQPGECWNDLSAEDKKDHWFFNYMVTEDILGSPGDKCFFHYGTCLPDGSSYFSTLYPGFADECTPVDDII